MNLNGTCPICGAYLNYRMGSSFGNIYQIIYCPICKKELEQKTYQSTFTQPHSDFPTSANGSGRFRIKPISLTSSSDCQNELFLKTNNFSIRCRQLKNCKKVKLLIKKKES